MKIYSQLTQDQRYQISNLKRIGMNQTAIALELGVDKSTISRELTRNIGGNGYHAKQAQLFSDNRRKMAEKHIKMTSDLKQTIREQLCDDWSPDQIAGRLKQTENILISHESIYKYILEDKDSGGELYKHLRHFGKKRKKRYGSPDRRGQIKNRVSIEKRPTIVDKKTRTERIFIQENGCFDFANLAGTLWTCGQSLRGEQSHVGRMEKPWTTFVKVAHRLFHTLCSLANDTHRANHN